MSIFVCEKHKGIAILHEQGEGYFWEDGLNAGGGPFETIEACRADIDLDQAEDLEGDPEWPMPDTPVLSEAWWRDI